LCASIAEIGKWVGSVNGWKVLFLDIAKLQWSGTSLIVGLSEKGIIKGELEKEKKPSS